MKPMSNFFLLHTGYLSHFAIAWDWTISPTELAQQKYQITQQTDPIASLGNLNAAHP